MNDSVASSALLAAPVKPATPAPQLIVEVARQHSVSPFRQFSEMLRSHYGKQGVAFHEYYNNQIYRPDFSAEDKRAFVGEKGSYKLNKRLSPLNMTTPMRVFIRDKVFYGSMIAKLGFRTTETQAVVSRTRSYGDIPVLRSVEDIEAFVIKDARYPIFVKPEEGSGSVGSALIDGVDPETRLLHLSNGNSIAISAFAQEVLAEYSEGFIIQSAVQQHPSLTEIAGKAIGTIRVVTIMRDTGPEILYTLWKIPSPEAMSDNYWQAGSMIAEIDKANGMLTQCRRGSGPSQEMIEAHPVSDKTFKGFQVPHWDEICDMTTRGHALFPHFGVFGWDIAVTQDGPVVIECNANPHHMLYQLATGRGILNADFTPIFDEIAERAQVIMKDMKKAYREELRKHS